MPAAGSRSAAVSSTRAIHWSTTSACSDLLRGHHEPPDRGHRVTESFDRLSLALADRYRIERELGAGGMATVYLAHDIKHADPGHAQRGLGPSDNPETPPCFRQPSRGPRHVS
jgi:serine/threonine protein kinase